MRPLFPFLLAAWLLVASPALAGTVEMADTVLAWLLSGTGLVVVVILLGIARQALRTYADSRRLQADHIVRSALLPFLDLLASAALARLGPGAVAAVIGGNATAPEAERLAIEVDAAVAEARRVHPDAVRHFGLSPADLRAALVKRIEAKVAG